MPGEVGSPKPLVGYLCAHLVDSNLRQRRVIRLEGGIRAEIAGDLLC
jgi:hypothetical protein